MVTTIVALCLLASPDEVGGLEHFEKKVRPILVEHCYECHSGDRARVKGGLSLDHRDGLLLGGHSGPAIVPGDPDASRLIHAIRYDSADLQMPPRGKLGAAVVADFERWVLEGAPDPRPAPNTPDTSSLPAREIDWAEARSFWAFQPPSEPAIPAALDAGFARSSLDSLVLARLDEEGLHQAPPADRRTLIRRLCYDLTGLPPTPEEVAAFLDDAAPDAYERQVDRLLDSPRYGEHWGRQWLDVARYADSNGLDENLAYAHAFRYRDYVIRSFNDDKPYDRMLREQIAGDLLPRAGSDTDNDLLIATGFLSLGPKMLACDDGRKMELDIVDEQIDTVSRATMALTMACARCHDHKFDPLPTKDYYALAGIFKSTKTMENFKVVAQWHEHEVSTAAERETLRLHTEQEAAKKQELEQFRERARNEFFAHERNKAPQTLASAIAIARSGAGPWPDGEHSVGLEAVLEGLPAQAGILREAESFDRGTLQKDDTNWGKGVGVFLGQGFAEFDLELAAAGRYQLELLYAAQDARPMQLTLDGRILKEDAAGQVTGGWFPDQQRWFVEGVYEFAAGTNVLRFERTTGPSPHVDKILIVRMPEVAAANSLRQELVARFELRPELLSRFMQAIRVAPASDGSWSSWLEASEFEFDAALTDFCERFRRASDPEDTDPSLTPFRALLDGESSPFALLGDPERLYDPATKDRIAALEAEAKELLETRPVMPLAMGVCEGTVEDLPVHVRGNYLTLGESVPRRPPRVLAEGECSDFVAPNDRSGRLEFAQWLTRADHPLTARVMANRVWLGLFGEGIVRTPDNFGRLGERPSHPELLDWLALRFVEGGWSIKALIREIVCSGTYRMSSEFDAEAAAKDPENRLLWRHARRRLRAEQLRDTLLAVCGQLDRTMGGQLLPNGNRAYVTGTGSNAANYAFDRRSVYLPVLRSAVYDVFQAFDFADPSMMSGQRASTTVAPQSLFLMNGELVQKCTRALAEELLALPEVDDRRRVEALYQRAFSRPATPTEIDRALEFVARYRRLQAEKRAGEIAADSTVENADETALTLRCWQGLCRVIVASNEFLYIE